MAYASSNSTFDGIEEAEDYLEELSLLEKFGAAVGITDESGRYREAKQVLDSHTSMKQLEPYLEDVEAEKAYEVLSYLDNQPAVPSNIALETEQHPDEVVAALDDIPRDFVMSISTGATGPYTDRMYYVTGKGHTLLHR